MREKIDSLYHHFYKSRSEFFQTVLKLSLGSGIAGLIPIILSPILTRFYGPDDFGTFAIYLSIINIANAFVGLRYEMAIILPKEDNKALRLATLSILFSLVIGTFLLGISLLFKDAINHFLKTDGWIWIPLVVINLILSNFYQVTFFWCSRNKLFSQVSLNRILQNGLIGAFQLLLALLIFQNYFGLLMGRTLGVLLSALILGRILWKEIRHSKEDLSWQNLKETAQEFIHFPKHMMITQGISVFYAQIPVWFITYQFSKAAAGNFSLAYQIVTIPTALVVTSFGDTFRKFATDLYHQQGRFDQLFINTVKKTALLSSIPFLVFFLSSEFVFNLVYGNQWLLAGKMAGILSLMVMVNIITNPVDNSAIIVGRTGFLFSWHLCRMLMNFGVVALCIFFKWDILQYLYAWVAMNILLYAVSFSFMYKFSKGSTPSE
jgi:O-antigen/teichoic acid export membrane protein